MPVQVGLPTTALVVLRGNSGSGKSTVARALRDGWGRGIAIISQDVVRRDILREKERPGGVNIGLIDTMARYALDHGHHVIVEGILRAERYGHMLERLRRDHAGKTTFWYWDLPFEVTLERHATKPQASEYGEAEMRDWFTPRDLLGLPGERSFAANVTVEKAVAEIRAVSGLATTPPALHPR